MKKTMLFLLGLFILPFASHSQSLSFTVSSDTVYVGDTITFTNTSTGFSGSQQFSWVMGDNCTSGYDYIPDSCKIITTGVSAIVKKAYLGSGRYTVYLRSKTGTTISTDVFSVNIYIKSNAVPPNPPTCGLIRNGSFDEGIGVNTIFSSNYPLIPDASPWDRPMVIPTSCISGLTAPPTVHNFPTLLFSSSTFGHFVPNNNYGFQTAFNGTGYGMVLAYGPGPYPNPYYDNHSYIQQPLPYALIPGEQYLVSFRASLSEFSRHKTKLGAVLTTTNVAGVFCSNTQDNIIHLASAPDVLSAAQINDPSIWFNPPITGTVTGAGQKYITIGRFDYPGSTDTPTQLSVGSGGAYYYIDSVRITPSCCVDADFVVTTGQTTSLDIIQYFNTNVVQGKRIYVGVDLTITDDITFEGCELIMFKDVNINIPAGRKLTIKQYTLGMFSTLSQIYAGCTRMWGSINLQTSTSRLDMNNTIISDGQTAVLSNSGGVFNINNCTFNKNYIAIRVQNGGSYGGTIYANTFKCDQNISLPPYAGQVCQAGIDIRNTSNVNIGNSAQPQNIFTGIQSTGAGIGITNGIKGDASGITAVNNLFTRCSTGIYLTNALQIANPSSTIGTSATIGQFNTFTNCVTGISTVNRQNLSINNNLFNTITTNNIAYSGISISDPLTGIVNIIENIINDYPFGIGVANVSLNNADVSIRNNFINQATTALKTMRTGISISNLRTNNFNNVLIRANRVFFGGAVTNNDISTCTPTFFDPCNRIGISVTNCEFPYILENTVNRATNNPNAAVIDRLLGIRLEFTANAYLCSNTLTRMGSGVLTVGSNAKIIYVLNTFDFCWNMFRFNNANNIPLQGNSFIGTRDNQWVNLINLTNPRITGTFNVANLAIQWDFKNSLPNFNVNPITITPPLLISANPITYTPIPLCPNTTGRLAQEDTISNSGDNDLVHLLAAIAQDTIEYINYASQSRYWDRSKAYNYAKNDAGLTDEYTAEETAIDLFYHQEQVGNIGLIDSLNALAAVNDTIAFTQLNSQLQPQNNIEEYRKTVNTIYAATWLKGRYELTQEEVDILTPIATDNPLWGGDAVYSARVLLNLNHSNQEGEENPLYKTIDNTKENNSRVIVYPNPGNGNINIKYALDQTATATFAVYNVNGQLIKSVPLNGVTGTLNIDMSAQKNGIYFYRLLVNGSTADVGKLAIIK